MDYSSDLISVDHLLLFEIIRTVYQILRHVSGSEFSKFLIYLEVFCFFVKPTR